MNSIPKVAVVGLGGFAASHHEALSALELKGVCRVVATCDPDADLIAAQSERFRFYERDVQLHRTLEDLLEVHGGDLDLVTLPIPIPLHAEYHRAVLAAGAGCYLEKPPSLWWPEFCGMLQVDAAAGKASQIGFNFVGDPFRRTLKERVIGDEFGPLLGVRFEAVWPRDAAYYARNDWAGKLRSGDKWVLDSCIGNAMAHYVQNLLFWCGSEDVDSVGRVQGVQAWLGRTRPIESYDTALVGASLENGVQLRIGATHDASGEYMDRETLLFENAKIVFSRWNRASIEYSNGSVEECKSEFEDQSALLQFNLMEYLEYLSGRSLRPTTSLSDSQSFVALCDLALVSSSAIHDIDALPDLNRFVELGEWPGAEPETAPLGVLDHLAGVADRVLIASSRKDSGQN